MSAALEPTSCKEAEPFALQIRDDSMAPEFWPGCIVIIDPTGIARDGVYVLAELDAEFVVRRLQRQSAYWKLTPLNDDYETTGSVSLENIVGVVSQRAGSRRRHHKRYDV